MVIYGKIMKIEKNKVTNGLLHDKVTDISQIISVKARCDYIFNKSLLMI